MSKFEDGSYGSLTGISLIAKVLAGRCKMKYTRATVGKGFIPDRETPKTMTNSADYVMDARIADITNPVDGECQVTVQLRSDDVEHGFYLTNVVLFAEDPDLGEVPYTYLVLENNPEWIRPASNIVGKVVTFDLIAAVGDVDKVVAIIDPDSYVTRRQLQQEIEEHDSDPSAHGGIGQAKISEITILVSSWIEDNGIYKAILPLEDANDNVYPSITIHPDSLPIAKDAMLKNIVKTGDNTIVFWSNTIPLDDIKTTVALFKASGSGGFTSSSRLPIATNYKLGGVKVPPNSGLVIDEEGNLSIDASTSNEIEDLFEN